MISAADGVLTNHRCPDGTRGQRGSWRLWIRGQDAFIADHEQRPMYVVGVQVNVVAELLDLDVGRLAGRKPTCGGGQQHGGKVL